jgi:hypothetical protein
MCLKVPVLVPISCKRFRITFLLFFLFFSSSFKPLKTLLFLHTLINAILHCRSCLFSRHSVFDYHVVLQIRRHESSKQPTVETWASDLLSDSYNIISSNSETLYLLIFFMEKILTYKLYYDY